MTTAESYVRNGHRVSIEADQDSTGQWTWSYTIDADGYTEMRERPLGTSGEAIAAAQEHANAKADALRRADAGQ